MILPGQYTLLLKKIATGCRILSRELLHRGLIEGDIAVNGQPVFATK